MVKISYFKAHICYMESLIYTHLNKKKQNNPENKN